MRKLIFFIVFNYFIAIASCEAQLLKGFTVDIIKLENDTSLTDIDLNDNLSKIADDLYKSARSMGAQISEKEWSGWAEAMLSLPQSKRLSRMPGWARIEGAYLQSICSYLNTDAQVKKLKTNDPLSWSLVSKVSETLDLMNTRYVAFGMRAKAILSSRAAPVDPKILESQYKNFSCNQIAHHIPQTLFWLNNLWSNIFPGLKDSALLAELKKHPVKNPEAFFLKLEQR